MSPVRRGCLIALEGIDGCGKSTQARILADRLGAPIDALLTFEPGATGLGASIRTLLLDPGDPTRPDRPHVGIRTEALLLAADRAQHVTELIEPALAQGIWVVTDRYAASTLAYQGYGRELDRTELDELTTWATGGLSADLTVLVEVSVAVAAVRRSRREEADRFEAQGDGFQQRVADGYRTLAAESEVPWAVVDGTGTIEDVATSVWAEVGRLREAW